MSRPLRVLIAEDKADDAELIVRELRRAGYAPDWVRVDTEADFAARLSPDLDVILSDYAMPEFSGLRALEVLHEHGLEIPFLIISGTIGEDTAVAAMKQGAADYLLKDRLARLGPAIHHALEQGRLRREGRQAEEAMRQSEHKYRHLFESLSEAAFLIECSSRRVVDANLRGEDLLGRNRAEILGMDEGDLFPSHESAENGCQLTKADAHGHLEEAAVVTKDGRRIPVQISVAPVDLYGRHLVLALMTDITERKALEARLLRAQRMESIGTLASGLAHDLNNILAPIMMSAPLLRRDLPPEVREGIVFTIETSAARGAQIVRQVLTFGRGLEGERTPLQLGELLAELRQIIGETFPKKIAVEVSSAPDLWPIIGDATQLHQVLMNLAVNARDAMPDGGTLRICAANFPMDQGHASLLPGAKAGPYILIEVTDMGCGIAPEIVDRIFDPFFTTKGVGKGSGLGLSTAFGIVRSHGGFIKVSSVVGKESCFQVLLPAAPSPAAGPDLATAAPATPVSRGEVLLVADDEETVRESTATVLREHGYEVLLAIDGIEALDVFSRNASRIAAVLTDVMMPKMDGLALTRALRKMQPGLPIIPTTGLGEEAQRAEWYALGVAKVLAKPFGADTLLQAVHEALRAPTGSRRPGE